RQLLDQMESISPCPNSQNILLEKAYRLLNSKELQHAMNLTQESDKTRERYGFFEAPVIKSNGVIQGKVKEVPFAWQMRGQNLLMARRLVEAGVPFVNVNDFRQQGQNWDAHFKCFNQHKSFLLPQADQGLSALIEDLDERGMLDETLVVAMGEFGRTPRIGRVVMNAATDASGRDHWPGAYSVLVAGGKTRRGTVYGASDNHAAYVVDQPVSPPDLHATIMASLRISPNARFTDTRGHSHRVSDGVPVTGLF
ncbi:MAG: DUF1501 domain-containing protein, partial [bacterium]